ncbi:LOW QUALITY PROTEIN: hypothetical protein Cgig2_008417 [Carnegiea gigantea]|uniref:Uncharacterized protein n=1 Tax=Carnegiea gigantea TaxID=171969 RepID=A0A9Q1K3B1_9CARY|nr:LOW QUALITY PROTEIN: hypothetical protein Cgig2_008417 [Carnegiea gigantea]
MRRSKSWKKKGICLVRRMELGKHFIQTNMEPEWMVWINELHRKIISQNDTLSNLLPRSRSMLVEQVTCHAKLVQEVVDRLLDNGICRQPMCDDHNKVKRGDFMGLYLLNISIIPAVPSLLQDPHFHYIDVDCLAFQAILVEGHAICLHPSIYKGLSAHFDGHKKNDYSCTFIFGGSSKGLFTYCKYFVPSYWGSHFRTNLKYDYWTLCINENQKNYQNERIDNNKYTKEPFFCNSYTPFVATVSNQINVLLLQVKPQSKFVKNLWVPIMKFMDTI